MSTQYGRCWLKEELFPRICGVVVNVICAVQTVRKPGGRNDEAIRRAICYAGMFVIRTNAQSDPFKALEVYRMRGIVELDFQQFKN